MAPAVTEAPVSPKNPQNGDSEVNKSSRHKPLKSSGALDHFSSEETTPILGREYLDLDIVDDLLNADNADERLRDLAIASEQHCHKRSVSNLTAYQSPSVALSSFGRSPN